MAAAAATAWHTLVNAVHAAPALELALQLAFGLILYVLLVFVASVLALVCVTALVSSAAADAARDGDGGDDDGDAHVVAEEMAGAASDTSARAAVAYTLSRFAERLVAPLAWMLTTALTLAARGVAQLATNPTLYAGAGALCIACATWSYFYPELTAAYVTGYTLLTWWRRARRA